MSALRDEPAGRPAGVLAVAVVLAVLAGAALVGLRPGTGSMALAVLLAGAGGLALLLPRPAAGMAALVAASIVLPLQIATGTDVSLTPPVLLIPALAAVWLLRGLPARTLRLPRSRTVLPLLLLVGSGLLSLAAGRAYWDPLVPQPANLLLVQLAAWAVYALSAAIFLLAAGWAQEERWLRLAVHTFLALAAVMTLPYIVPGLWPVLSWGEWPNSPLLWSWLGGLGTGQLVFNRRLRPASRLAMLLLLALAAYVLWVVQAGWISGWLPFTTAVLLVVWLALLRRSRPAALAALLCLALLAGLLYPVLFRFAGGEEEYAVSGGGRLILYRATLDLVKDHPILGLGPAAYRHYGFTTWITLGYGRALYTRPLISSHNNYIDIYAQMGLVGLALFFWFAWELGRLGWRLRDRFRGDFADGYVHGALGGFAATLVAMMLIDSFLPFLYNTTFRGFRISSLAWMFLGGLVALDLRSRDGEGADKTGETPADRSPQRGRHVPARLPPTPQLGE